MLVRDAVHVEPLLGRADTTGHSDSNHERVGGLETLGLERLSDVSVILQNDQHSLSMHDIGCTHLHISTVELGQLSV